MPATPTVSLAAAPYLNLPLRDNGVPPVRELTVANAGSEALADVTVRLTAQPAALAPVSWRVDALAPGETRRLPLDRLELDYELLRTLGESERGRLTAVCTDAAGAEFARATAEVRLLPPQHWGGTAAVPELLAAHVLPNDEAVPPLLRRAAELLQSQGLSLNGYQSKEPRQAGAQALALLQAVAEWRVHYSVAPASFERHGQKVRTPSGIRAEGLGNCLDLACLVAAGLEQIGLHAGVVLVEAHAFATVWLQRSPLTTGVIRDPQGLRKSLQQGLLLAIETTALTGRDADVNAALTQGARHFDDTADFEVAVDLHAARVGEHVRPLNLRRRPEAPADLDAPGVLRSADRGTTPPALDLSALSTVRAGTVGDDAGEGVGPPAAAPTETGSARVQRWKSQLLNLTRRNRLLNWRPTGGALLLRFVDGARLEDRLADGARLSFGTIDARRATAGALGRDLPDDHYAQAVEAGLAQGKLLVIGEADGLRARLIKLERTTRTSLEEGGANTLFLAIGFAVKPRPGGTNAVDGRARAAERPEYAAPLILLPVELKRRRAGATFSLVARDEDAVLNPTLQELLRQEAGVDFGPLSRELPADESGVDVPGVLRAVRDELLNVPGWEVTEDVALGEFSFAKYLMWRDLDAFEAQLKENAVVRHLIDTPREPFHDPTDATAQAFPEPDRLDETFPVAEMLTPMSADASQLAAVRAAAQGIDFVLEGPPGTGKSQTITNLIAQCLGEGKTVLFVSEKTAALEVVERRLGQVGLGEFCLELHSNRATKTAVYDQLRQAMQQARPGATDYAARAAALARVRTDLNAQVEALHAVGPQGLSVFQLVSYAAAREGLDVPEPDPETAGAWTTETLSRAREHVRVLALRLADVSPAAREALRPVTRLTDAAAVAETCRDAIATAAELNDASAKLATALSVRVLPDDRPAQRRLGQLAELLLGAEGHDYAAVADVVDSGRARRSLAAETEATMALAAAFTALSGRYRPDVAALDAAPLAAKWTATEEAFALWRWIQHWLLARRLKAYAETAPEDAGDDLARLAEVQRQRGLLSDETRPELTPSAVAAAERRAAWTARLSAWAGGGGAEALGLTGAELASVLDDVAEERPAGRDALAAARAYPGVLARADDAAAALRGLAGLPDEPPAGTTVTALAEALLDHERDWRTHGLFAEARAAARGDGLGYLVDADYDASGLAAGPNAALERFEVGVRRVLAKAALASHPQLRAFSGTAFEDLIARFGRLDAEFQEAVRDELRARLHERQQGIYRQELRTAIGVLNNELQKKRRQLPVRQLVKRIGTLLPELTPCVLMSPLSIAQYLPADSAEVRFDVVVFDEASQIPVWDAIGAIARGQQVIVVGDSKQLPPTNFFSRADADDVYEDTDPEEVVAEDMESILDEMKAASLRTRRLRWHYRSRAESLIAFSNRTYYDGELNTFPAPVAEDRAVRWHKVESRDYLAGRNRTEARALVDYLVGRLRKTSPAERTFGVVTFGQAQQTVIEDLLEVARQDYPEIEPHFNDDLDERLFVKNIENVQGDERAVILFSVTYGPDAAGKVAMRFGPMNSSGGERRLNVAVTRAREEMHLFASMEPEQIDLGRLGVNAQGARDLRAFMSFAKRGPRAFAERVESVGGQHDYDSPFERAVAEALRAEGFAVDTQVGVSGYRIDLGVRDPAREGHYLAGVECDGASYHSTATARERDLLRQQVLEGLGWNIVRVWSLDWWYDRERTLRKLAATLRALKSEPPEREAGVPPRRAAEPAEVAEIVADADPVDATPPPEVPDAYRRADLSDFGPADEEAFYDGRLDGAIGRMTERVLAAEAPVLLDVLVKRIAAEGLGFGRTGSRIRAQIEAAVARHSHRTPDLDGATLAWRDEGQATENVPFRPPATGEDARGIAEIPLVELRTLAQALIREGLDEDALVREMGARIGLASVRGSSRERVRVAVEAAWG